MILAQHWSRSAKTLTTLTPADLKPGGARQLAAGDTVWIDLADPTPEEEALVLQRYLPIHPLSLEDATRLRREPDAPPHFPKVEEFPDYLFIITNPLLPQFVSAVKGADGELEEQRLFTQVSAVLTHQVLVTHHYRRLGSIDFLRDHLARHPDQCDRGPDYLFHLGLDYSVDQFVPVLDYVDARLDKVEGEILRRPRPALFTHLLRLKRQIVVLRKVLIYEREVLVRLARGEFALVDERETVYYRNVYDHLVRFTELIETSRDMVSDLMQTHLAATGNRLNEIMKVLAMISTVGAIWTVVAGIYGMNFDPDVSPWNMPELKWAYGYPFALGLMATGTALALGFFKWRKWL